MDFIEKEIKENGYDYVALIMFLVSCFAMFKGWI